MRTCQGSWDTSASRVQLLLLRHHQARLYEDGIGRHAHARGHRVQPAGAPRWLLAPAAGVAEPTAIGTCAGELALAHDVAQEREREHERVCFPPHESHGLFCGVFLSLFIGVYTISRSDFPSTPAHAATCPPKARGRFQACVAEDLVTIP